MLLKIRVLNSSYKEITLRGVRKNQYKKVRRKKEEKRSKRKSPIKKNKK